MSDKGEPPCKSSSKINFSCKNRRERVEKQLSSYKRIDLHWENKQVFLYFSVELCSADDGDCLVPLAQCHTFCCLYKVIKK